MTEVVYIMACNYSYCEPKLPLSLTTHQLVSTMQIKHLASGWALGMQIKHSPRFQVASVYPIGIDNQSEIVS